jgi:hypothetical protein
VTPAYNECSSLGQPIDGRQSSTNPKVIDDRATFVEGHVEVSPHEDAPTRQITEVGFKILEAWNISHETLCSALDLGAREHRHVNEPI